MTTLLNLLSDTLLVRSTRLEPRALLPLFDRGLAPLVFEGSTFLGLITRMELLTHLRRQLC